jgi:hypothetical protein
MKHLDEIELIPEHRKVLDAARAAFTWLFGVGRATTCKAADGTVLFVGGLGCVPQPEIFLFPSARARRYAKEFWRGIRAETQRAREAFPGVQAFEAPPFKLGSYFRHLGFAGFDPAVRAGVEGRVWV